MVPKHIIRVVRRHLSTSTIASPCSNIPICPHTIFSKNPYLKGNNEFKDWSNIKTLNLLKNAQIIGTIVKLNCLRIRIRWKRFVSMFTQYFISEYPPWNFSKSSFLQFLGLALQQAQDKWQANPIIWKYNTCLNT